MPAFFIITLVALLLAATTAAVAEPPERADGEAVIQPARPALAFVLLNGERVAAAADLADLFADALGVEPDDVIVEAGQDGEAVLQIGDVMLAVTHVPAPYPRDELEGPAATAFWWPAAAEVVRDHTGHFLVAVLGGRDLSPLDRRLVLTRMTAEVARRSNAAGIYWGESTTLWPPDLFLDAATDASADNPPVIIWVDCRVESLARDASGPPFRVFTTGREAFGLPELECRRTTLPPGDVRDLFWGLTTYQLTTGTTIGDGETVGPTAEERHRVHETPSMFDRNRVLTVNLP